MSYFFEHARYMSFIGVVCTLAIAYACSNNRSKINLKLVFNALLMQFALGFLILKTEIGAAVFASISTGVGKLYLFSEDGIRFVFGSLADMNGPWGMVFAVRVLPIIIFFGALMSLLFHLKIVQKVVNCASYVVQPLLGTSGAETVCAISNSFLGQTEAPLLIRNYLKDMTHSEMMVVMVSGFATLSGAILVVYAAIGVPILHLLAASMMAIPGSILMSKMLYPETEKTKTEAIVEVAPATKNILEALAVGTTDGLYLALNVGAMLISFLGIIALVNALLGSCSSLFNYLMTMLNLGLQLPALSLNVLFSYLFAPFAYLLGLSGNEATLGAELLGLKLSINEFIAFDKMVVMDLSLRSRAILTYALCGFANFSCIGIQIGGIGSLVPEKKTVLSELGMRALLGATLVNFMSALIANILL
jgi:CNT family concentrative nucleoside transporter